MLTTAAPFAASAAAMRNALQEIHFLFERGGAMEEFLTRFLDLVITASGARGGALWSVQGGVPQLACQSHFEDCLYEANELQHESIAFALGDAVQAARPSIVGPSDTDGHMFEAMGRRLVNLSPHAFIYVPALGGGVGKKPAPAVIHLWVSPDQTPAQFTELVQFLQQAGERLGRFLEAKRVESLETNAEALQQLYQLATQLTGQFDLQALGVALANRGREIIVCDRLVVFAQRTSGRLRALAVSNVEVLNEKSSVVQTQVMLAEEAIATGRPTLYQKTAPKTEELGDISDYFFHSRTEEAFAIPLRDGQGRWVGALLAEFNDRKNTPQARKVAQAVSTQAAKALAGALEIEAIPLLPVVKRLGAARELFREEARRKTMVRYGVPIGIALLVMIFPLRLTVQSDCAVMPVIQGYAVAEVSGRLTKIMVQEGDQVAEGQIIATVNDLDIKQELLVAEEERRKAEAEANRLEARGDEAGSRVALIEAARSARKVDQIKLSLDKTNIRSPIAGTIVSKQIQNHVGEVLSFGSRFCEVADLRQWEVLSKLSEADLGLVDHKLRTEGQASVGFALLSMPDRKFTAQIDGLASLGQSSLPIQGANVFLVRAAITDPQTAQWLKPGYTGRSKIPIGWRPAGWLAVRKFVSYLKVRWLQ